VGGYCAGGGLEGVAVGLGEAIRGEELVGSGEISCGGIAEGSGLLVLEVLFC